MTRPLPALSLPPALASGASDCAPVEGGPVVFRKPATTDAFVNASLTSVGPGPDGAERFWGSCVNTLAGATSYLIDENGGYRTYRWPVERGILSLYAVAQEDEDTLWVAGGGTEHFIRLTLSSGEWKAYRREAGRFVTAGIVLDPGTGKLFCGAQTALISFDTRSGRTARVYGPDERPPECHPYDHWRLPDGSYGFIMDTPALSFLRWDPRAEAISWRRLSDDPEHPAIPLIRKLKYVKDGCVYLPHLGWFDGLTCEIRPHDPPPEEEACWFGPRGRFVTGTQYDVASVCARFVEWDTATGRVRPLCSAPDTMHLNCALSRSGKILVLDVYGHFKRYDARTGELELTRVVESLNAQLCNTLTPVGGDLAVGTPFIAQNFWVCDTRKGARLAAGRAAGSMGQVDHAVQVNGRVYMSVYGGGQLVEYDPAKPAGFPRNPRLVAQNEQGQHGTGITTDGRVVWASFRPRYGTLDGAMIRYDTETGEARTRSAALPSQHTINPVFDPATGLLVAGTSFLSDCETATPVHERAFVVVLDPERLAVTGKAEGPAGVNTIFTLGPLEGGRWLVQCGDALHVFDADRLTLTPHGARKALPEGTVKTVWAGRPGRFIIQSGDGFQVWEAGRDTFTPFASTAPGFVRRWWVHGRDMAFDCGLYAAVWRGCLPDGAAWG